MKTKEKTIEETKMNPAFWSGKKVLITGHTGFKGAWLSFWLSKMGAKVKGISLAPATEPNLYSLLSCSDEIESTIGDIRDLQFLKNEVNTFSPEIIFHLAAQSIVHDSYTNPIDTFETNVMGTANVLEAAKSAGDLKAILCITSDKCYENREWPWKYRENDAMGGHDPYSASKGCSELVISSFQKSFFSADSYDKHGVGIASARAGNVIGGGDWSACRLVPDIMRSFSNNHPVTIRNPEAIRPWQHVLDVLRGYIILVEKLYVNGNQYSGAWNFGPAAASEKGVLEIVEYMTRAWGDGASWEQDESENPHEANILKLDSSKAQSHLGWKPVLSLDESLDYVVEWYKKFYEGAQNARSITEKQIDSFEKHYKTFMGSNFLNLLLFLNFV